MAEEIETDDQDKGKRPPLTKSDPQKRAVAKALSDVQKRDRQAKLNKQHGVGEAADPALDLERGKPVQPQGPPPVPVFIQPGQQQIDQPDFGGIRTDVGGPVQPQLPQPPPVQPAQKQTPQEQVQENARNRANLRRENLGRPPIAAPFTFEGEPPVGDKPQPVDAPPQERRAEPVRRAPIDVNQPEGRGDAAAGANTEAIVNALRPLLAEQTAAIVAQLTTIIKENQGYAA